LRNNQPALRSDRVWPLAPDDPDSRNFLCGTSAVSARTTEIWPRKIPNLKAFLP